MYVGVACLGGRSIVCSLVFSSWFVYISSFYNKVDASSSKTCIITCEELFIPRWTLAYLLVYIQNVLHAEYFVYPSRCPLILSTWFCPRRPTTMDLLAPRSSLFWLGSVRGKARRQQDDATTPPKGVAYSLLLCSSSCSSSKGLLTVASSRYCPCFFP